jgi:hypothetical protein
MASAAVSKAQEPPVSKAQEPPDTLEAGELTLESHTFLDNCLPCCDAPRRTLRIAFYERMPMALLHITYPLAIYFYCTMDKDDPSSAARTFVSAILATIPLSELLSFATEQLSLHTHECYAGLLNASFGNVPEFVMTIIAISHGQSSVATQTLVGGVLSSSLLVGGLSSFVGGESPTLLSLDLWCLHLAFALLRSNATTGTAHKLPFDFCSCDPLTRVQSIRRKDLNAPTPHRCLRAQRPLLIALIACVCVCARTSRLQAQTHEVQCGRHEHPDDLAHSSCARSGVHVLPASTGIWRSGRPAKGKGLNDHPRCFSRSLTSPDGFVLRVSLLLLVIA